MAAQEKDETTTSRRRLVADASAVLAAALAAPAAVAAPGQNGNTLACIGVPQQSIKQNPLTQYVRPPFQAQYQPPPGLASLMVPPPDHGETTYQGTGRLVGRKALITGGDSGIGRAAAIAFAREGADVAINYLPVEQPDADQVISLIQSAGRNAVAIPGDIRTEAFCQSLVSQAASSMGGIDILVNNAGQQQSQMAIADLTTAQFDSTFKTNVYAMFWITKAALPYMTAGASIINTASVEAYDPQANLLDYAPTKAAIVAFTKALAKQVAIKGIRVNAVAPGPVWTPLQVSGGQPQSQLATFGNTTAYGRPGEPAELGPVYVFLASQEASFVTAQVYGASGGQGQP